MPTESGGTHSIAALSKEASSYSSTFGRRPREPTMLQNILANKGSPSGFHRWAHWCHHWHRLGLPDSMRWQLWLSCLQCLHVNYHIVFYNYLMNSDSKVIPLRKMKLPRKCLTKKKHQSLPARAWTANALTHPAASVEEQTDLGAILSFPSGVGSSSPIFWARRCSAFRQVFWREACSSQSSTAMIRLLQHVSESQPGMEEKDFCLGFL